MLKINKDFKPVKEEEFDYEEYDIGYDIETDFGSIGTMSVRQNKSYQTKDFSFEYKDYNSMFGTHEYDDIIAYRPSDKYGRYNDSFIVY